MARFASRRSATGIFAILLAAAFVTVTVPLASMGQESTRASTEAVPGDRTFTIGIYGLNVGNLNPLLYTSTYEYMTIWPCYSTLLAYNLEGNIVGDLATSWSVSADGLTWEFELVDNALFYDPANPAVQQPVTVEDVMFTLSLCQNYYHSLSYYFQHGPISSMAASGPFSLTIRLAQPSAPFMHALTVIPILPEYIWSNYEWDWMNFDANAGVWPCIGSGPLYYALPGLPTTDVELRKNPVWYQTENRGWQIRPNSIVYKYEVSLDAALMDFLNGGTDVLQEVPPPAYAQLQPFPNGIQGFSQSTGFVYEFNLNQMTDELRARLGGAYKAGYNNQLLLDPVVKTALAMCLDKQTFVEYVLQGYGSVADSLVPDVNPWHYTYGSIPGEEPFAFDPAGARMLLYNQGWNHRLDGSEITAYDPDFMTYFPLSRIEGDVAMDTLMFRFYSPDTDSEFYEGTLMIENWAAAAGIDLMPEFLSTMEMNSVWYSADYDVWFWDWVMGPLSDPSVEVLNVLTSMEIGGLSDVFYSSPTYDDIWLQSVGETNLAERRILTDELQRIAYEDSGCNCVAYGKSMYLVSSNTEEHWMNFGDWESQFLLMPEFGLPYLYMRIYPADNPAPIITSLVTTYEAIVDIPVSFSATAVDANGDALEYRWDFGDGTVSPWSSVPYASHTYAEDGIFTAYLMVREVSSADQFVSSAATRVIVLDPLNYAPSGLSFTYYPVDPTAGEMITFMGSAYDPDGDPLSYTWDFGDGSAGAGVSVTHSYEAGGGYEVTMYVDDGHIGVQARPVYWSSYIAVASNAVPTLVVPDFGDVLRKTDHLFEVTASDPDGDALLYTWSWGDGAVSFTTSNSCTHIYEKKGTYTLTVTVSDQTGLPGHEVQDTGIVVVIWRPFKGQH